MPLTFNTLLATAKIDPSAVRILRHKDKRAKKGKTPYELWLSDRPEFDRYQSRQAINNRPRLDALYWATFVATPAEETMFVGLYRVTYKGLLAHDEPMPHCDKIDEARKCDVYELELLPQFEEYAGKLFIDWGTGFRAWSQRCSSKDKPIVELRKEFKEAEFPGFNNFIGSLSTLDKLPPGWVTALRSVKGIYLLTCPKTKEQYVGSASGANGIWGRWQDYAENRHGGNVGLKSRELSDYQVSVLEVAGSAATTEDILGMEARWMRKLQSREMGLNR